LRALYAILAFSAVALATLIAGDVIYALQAGAEAHEDYPLFDLAWPVFLVTAGFTLMAGIAAFVGGKIRGMPALTRYGVWALGYCVLAVVAVTLSEMLGS
jgi:hypothetical protein